MPWAPGRVRVLRRAGGPSAFVMLELFLNTLRHSPGSGASQLALSCLQISPARPIFLCCLWHRLENLLQVLFALTLPVPSCSHSVGFPALGGSGVWTAFVSPSHQLSLGDVQMLPDSTWGTNSSSRFPSLPSEMSPSWSPSCSHSAVLRAVTGYWHRSPEDTGLPGQCPCWPSRGWHWASPGLCQPVQGRDASLQRSVPRMPLQARSERIPFRHRLWLAA